MNTSATGGYLLPDGEAVPNDQVLEDILQGFIKGVTGLSGAMVRPRFQVEPLPVPTIGVDWVAFGIQYQTPDDGPYFKQNDEDANSIRHESFEVMLSFYGSLGQTYAKRFVDGSAITQNIDQLKQYEIKFVEAGRIITAPDFINEQYVHRFDVTATFRRKTNQSYKIQSLQGFSKIKMRSLK